MFGRSHPGAKQQTYIPFRPRKMRRFIFTFTYQNSYKPLENFMHDSQRKAIVDSLSEALKTLIKTHCIQPNERAETSLLSGKSILIEYKIGSSYKVKKSHEKTIQFKVPSTSTQPEQTINTTEVFYKLSLYIDIAHSTHYSSSELMALIAEKCHKAYPCTYEAFVLAPPAQQAQPQEHKQSSEETQKSQPAIVKPKPIRATPDQEIASILSSAAPDKDLEIPRPDTPSPDRNSMASKS